jgi:hypothetical protein
MADSATPNRLAQESSPYLLQHKDNPVDWHPWGRAALDQARREDKPILLSVGYAACHWCHVMAHESFEDPEIAALMNDRFVNVKVDREERPDLDQIYQQALALLGQHGGWPLTMFLTPHGHPFWGGTYFPKREMYGRPGFAHVLEAIADVYRDEPDKVRKNVEGLRNGLQDLAKPQSAGMVPLQALDEVVGRLAPEFDRTHGGLGGPPKFPQPSILALLWRGHLRSGETGAREAVEITLTHMCQGGIYDHLGGGFARYSTDERWLVPHFEKMLYDNAQLLELLTQAWQYSGTALYRERAVETVDWLHREMIALDAEGAATGAFAATLDADSEGEEGRFYVWTAAEVDAVLGDDAAPFKRVYDITPEGNWEGRNIPNRLHALEPLDDATEARLAEARRRLFEARAARVRPGWDDKVLADWNGLTIHALAEAAAAFGRPDWLDSAERAFAFVAGHLERDGRLAHAWRRGQLRGAATLDDYAALIRAALTLFEHTGRDAYLTRARGWLEVLDAHYWDNSAGGYFATADDVDDVIVRTKGAHDNAQPSGNGLIVQCLARLHYLTGDTRHYDQAEAVVAAFSGELQRNFVPLATLLNGVELLQRGLQVAIVGDRAAADTQALLAQVHARCLPNRVLRVVPPDADLPDGHPAAGKGRHDGRATAYVCRGPACSLPLTDPEALAAELAR